LESSYYEWRGRAPRAIRHAWLTGQVTAIHAASRCTYGARRVHAELTLGQGIVGHGTVELVMRLTGIKGLPGTRKAQAEAPDADRWGPGAPPVRPPAA
jgi:putative transposase